MSEEGKLICIGQEKGQNQAQHKHSCMFLQIMEGPSLCNGVEAAPSHVVALASAILIQSFLTTFLRDNEEG